MTQEATRLLISCGAVFALSNLAFSIMAPKPGSEVPLAGWQMQDIAKVSEDGGTISSRSFHPSQWYEAVVPGTVLTTLVKAGVYPEPLYGENNRAIPESLCRTSYWYRSEFSVPSGYGENGRHTWIRFDGINYAAEVWVNGQHIGDMKGAYARGIFDITKDLAPGDKQAVVAVKILPPAHPGNPLEQTQAAGTGPNGGAIGADGPTFNATVGWDWIPGIRDRDMGIWQGVSLYSTGPVTVQDPYVTTTLPLPKTDSAELGITVDLQNQTDGPQTGVLVCRIEGTHLAARVPLTLQAGEKQTVSVPSIHFNHPKLWWPNGYGAPNLYKMRAEFVEKGGASDAKTVSFGVRTIDYFPKDNKNLTLIVNGTPVFAKGGNWGMDEAMKRSPRSRLEAQMRLHRDANYTIIRNWVGMATQEDFYDMCDKYGIMVWDDFWLANPVDGPNPLDPDLFLANAREKIVRFRNHPSIAVWCGRNEGYPPPKINAGIAKMVAELDGKRFYQPHSSATNGVGGGGPYSYRKPSDYFQFRDAFHTEIGGPSIPTLEAIENMMPRKDWWPINDDWAEHDFCRGAQQGDVYPRMLGARFGPVTGLEDFVRKGQLANYESYRAIYEGREAKLFDPATGVMIWMSNPSQPSFVWQIYTHDLEPTSALFAARKGGEPIHVMMDPRDNRVIVVNNTFKPLGAVTAIASIYGLDGLKISVQKGSVNAAASAASNAFTLQLTDPRIQSVYFVRLELNGSGGKRLSDNFYWYARPSKDNDYMPNDFAAMQTIPEVKLDADAELRMDATPRGTTRIVIHLHNRSKHIALMAHLQLRRANTLTRVLPAYFSDNYISLVPGELRELTVEASTSDLAGERPLITLDGWNVRVGQNPLDDASAVQVITNDAAIPKALPVISEQKTSGGSGFSRSLAAAGVGLSGTGYINDGDFADGGFARPQGAKVDLRGLGDQAAPLAAYQAPRSGEFSYSIPVAPLGPSESYTIRLHFADLTSTEAGARVFNVDVNGSPKLVDFDIFAEAQARAKAIVKEIKGVRPDDRGNIVIALRRGSVGFPMISAVQIFKP